MTWKAVLLAVLAAFGLFLVAVQSKKARHDRIWQPHLSKLPDVSLGQGTFGIGSYRNWAYPEEGPPIQQWTVLEDHRIADVRRAWLVMEPHPGLPVMAHTLVMFEFADGDLIGLTVEARKQADETYSPVRGTFNAFELIYQWATPRDLLVRRAVYLDKDLYLYPLVLSQTEVQAYLTALLERTRAIEKTPRFYNTLTSNCTNELAKTADLPWHPAFILTGGSAEALFGMGRIAGEGNFAAVKARAKVDDLVEERAALPDEDFNAAVISAGLGQMP